MELQKRSENLSGTLPKKPFARFHERIHNKYVEMQKKLHKSKSVDAITNLDDDFIVAPSKHLSTSDVREIEEIFPKDNTEEKVNKYSVIVEHISKREATVVECNEENLYDSTIFVTESIDNPNLYFFGDDFHSSFESLHAVELRDSGIQQESSPSPLASSTPVPSPRLSIRDKIGTRITAVKERRKEIRDKRESKKKETLEGVDKIILSNTSKKRIDSSKKKNKIASVTIALIEATGLDNDNASDEKPWRWYFCRFRLGTEKRKSKSIKTSSSENAVSWQELFNIGLFEDNFLEITIWDRDKDNPIGRSVLDLSEMEREKTHRMRLNLDDGEKHIQVFFLLTISGATVVNSFMDLDTYQLTQQKFKRKYAWYQLNNNFQDIGWMSVVVYGAKGLVSCDTYCVLELENDRLQTHTEYKTHDPNWMKIMEFSLKDITPILHVSIFDEKKSEAIGKICIPLLRVANEKKKWYALKDHTLKERARGSNPRILLEMKIYFNIIKASLRVINTKEENLLMTEPDFSRHLFGQNVTRAKVVIKWTLDAIKFLKTCFEWESRKSNVIALTIWLLFWGLYKAWMFPLLFLIPFILYRPEKYYLIKSLKQKVMKVEEVEESKEEKNKTLMQKLNGLHDIVQTVQNGIGKVAVFGESVKNLCNFTVPFLSFFSIFMIIVTSFVIYLIPFTYLLMGWGVHKFLRKILRPNRIPNSEILDLLSRVPDDETLLQCEELPLELPEEDEI